MVEFDPRADAEDLVQEPYDPVMMPAPVTVNGPVRVQMLPRTSAGAFSKLITSSPQRILTADPRRARSVLVPQTQDIYFGASGNEASGGYGAWWPKGIPLEINHTDEVWVSCAAGNTTLMTVLVENWTG